jgi:hypothetical protein
MIYRMIFEDLKMRHTKWGANATSCELLFPTPRADISQLVAGAPHSCMSHF